MDDLAIKVVNIGKCYSIGKRRSGDLRETFSYLWKNIKSNSSTALETDFWALKNISFELKSGEAIGIIGRNGAGKSTLLKILSRITKPSTGRFELTGRVSSLLEVGTGFHPELTGRENIFLNGTILGMRRVEINDKFEDIVAFSGVEEFIDTPVKHYSSGMKVRLAFSVAAHLEPEILIIDEVLAVGDADFQKKCLGKMEDVAGHGRTVIFVSHDLNAVSKLCQKVMVLESGKLAFSGPAIDAIRFYRRETKINTAYHCQNKNENKPIYFNHITVSDNAGSERHQFLYDENVIINFKIEVRNPTVKCDLFVMVLNSLKKRIFAIESNAIADKMKLVIDAKTLVRGSYSIHAFLNQPHVARLDEVEDVCHFEIIDNGSSMLKHGGYDYGDVFGRGKWILE